MLFATTFWSFPREFSSLTPAAIRNGPAGATIRSTSDKIAIKLGADYSCVVRLINTMVWGDPNTLALVENGTLVLQGLHAQRHGNGLQVQQDEVSAVNVNFTSRGGHLSLTESQAKATLLGTITHGPLELNGMPMGEEASGNIVSQGNISR